MSNGSFNFIERTRNIFCMKIEVIILVGGSTLNSKRYHAICNTHSQSCFSTITFPLNSWYNRKRLLTKWLWDFSSNVLFSFWDRFFLIREFTSKLSIVTVHENLVVACAYTLTQFNQLICNPFDARGRHPDSYFNVLAAEDLG